MNIKPITQKQAQKLWSLGVTTHWCYRWGSRNWCVVNYIWGSPLTQAKDALPTTLLFGVEVE